MTVHNFEVVDKHVTGHLTNLTDRIGRVILNIWFPETDHLSSIVHTFLIVMTSGLDHSKQILSSLTTLRPSLNGSA